MFGNTPYFFIGVSYYSDITTPPSSVHNFPFLKFLQPENFNVKEV